MTVVEGLEGLYAYKVANQTLGFAKPKNDQEKLMTKNPFPDYLLIFSAR